MKITLVTVGSLGDVAPIFALGLGLQRAGHGVRVMTYASFSPLARRLGLDLAPSNVTDPRELLASRQGREAFAIRDPFRAWRRFAALAEGVARTVCADALAACEGSDAVGYSGLGIFPGYAAAARLGLPYFAAHLMPIGRTSEFPSPLLPQGFAWLPGYNRASHSIAGWLVWHFFAPLVERAMASATGRRGDPFPAPDVVTAGARLSLFGISPSVLPVPQAWRWARFTGYWFLDEPQGWAPPPELVRFLERGPPPVVVGFGSMSARNPERTTRIVVEALRHAGVRGILLTGWGGIQPRELPEHVLSLEQVPHGWLFPRASVVVHHGGAGTTAATLRAGVPSVVVPFAFDQPFWAERVRRLGAGPAPIPERDLTSSRLAGAIRRAVEDTRMGLAARALGERLRTEDGVGTAIRELERAF